MTQRVPVSELVNCSSVNAAFRALWREWIDSGEWPAALCWTWPVQYPSMLTRLPLFVGMNPSYTERTEPSARLDSPLDLQSEERSSELVAAWRCAIGLDGAKPYPYFRKFSEVVEAVPACATPADVVLPHRRDWNHIDALGVRWTKQAELKGALGINEYGMTHSSFVLRQLELALGLIDALQPCVVVVVNALASTVLRKLVEHDLVWNERTGCDYRRSTPWIFSGMLTGQRALDKHSVRRLSWQIRHALRQVPEGSRSAPQLEGCATSAQ